MALNQSNRRHSFPIQNKIQQHNVVEEDIITMLGPLDTIVFPLTEENLALHTKNFPPCKDARRLHARIFVENQRPVVEMEMLLEVEREKEISSFLLEQENMINFSNPFTEQQQRKRNWLNKLAHWIRLDSIHVKEEKRRQRSRSAVTELFDHTTIKEEICQKRDSGISFFHQYKTSKRRSSSIAKSSPFVPIPIVRQPKFSPPFVLENEFVAFKYPKMVRKSGVNENNINCKNLLTTFSPSMDFVSHPTTTTATTTKNGCVLASKKKCIIIEPLSPFFKK